MSNLTFNKPGEYEWCFQFDESEPIVFATPREGEKEAHIILKLNNSSGNLEFFDNKNNKKFKLFARKKT